MSVATLGIIALTACQSPEIPTNVKILEEGTCKIKFGEYYDLALQKMQYSQPFIYV